MNRGDAFYRFQLQNDFLFHNNISSKAFIKMQTIILYFYGNLPLNR